MPSRRSTSPPWIQVETRTGSRRRALEHDGHLEEDLLRLLLDDPDRLVTESEVLKAGDRTSVVTTRGFVIKRFNTKGFGHTAAHAFMRSRARWNLLNARRLIDADIRTASPRAVLEETVGPARLRSWFVSDYLEGDTLLDLCTADAPPPDLEALAHAFADIWRKLGAARLRQDDLKASNLIVDRDRRLWMIDLDGVRRIRSAPAFARYRRLDRERFMRNWTPGSEVWSVFDAHAFTLSAS